MTSRHQLDQIIAGDILHHPPTVLHHSARAIDKSHAQKTVAASARLHPPRPAGIGRHNPANRAATLSPQDRPEIRHLKGQPLPLTCQKRLNLSQARARPHHQRQRPGLIKRDPAQTIGVQHITSALHNTPRATAPHHDGAHRPSDQIA